MRRMKPCRGPSAAGRSCRSARAGPCTILGQRPPGLPGRVKRFSSAYVALARLPVLHLLLGLVLADAVGVLDLADQLVALAGDPVELVVADLAPLLLDLALHLLPVAFDAIPVHAALL